MFEKKWCSYLYSSYYLHFKSFFLSYFPLFHLCLLLALFIPFPIVFSLFDFLFLLFIYPPFLFHFFCTFVPSLLFLPPPLFLLLSTTPPLLLLLLCMSCYIDKTVSTVVYRYTSFGNRKSYIYIYLSIYLSCDSEDMN